MTNETPITVYFESNSHAEIVAKFSDEETYAACFPVLQKMASEGRMIVTDSVDDT